VPPAVANEAIVGQSTATGNIIRRMFSPGADETVARRRLGVPVLLLATLAAAIAAIAAAKAGAVPHRNRGLTITATPNPILAGEGVLIYGRLSTKPVSAQTIMLYHHVAGTPGYTLVGRTTTDTAGFYEFTRAESVVVSNRSWYVKAAGAKGAHSRIVHERVAALVSLAASMSTGETGQPIVFSGDVTPNHAGDEVVLQKQVGTGAGGWKTLESAPLGPGSSYAIPYRFRIPGAYDLRVRLLGDARNTTAVSDATTVTIQQTQNRSFTINTSTPILEEGSPATISGTLDVAGTTTAKAGASVTLLGREAPFTAGNEFAPVASPVITDASGSYSFTVTPVHNVEYKVQMTAGPLAHRHTALLFEAVRDVVTIGPSSATATVGGSVTFTGTVAPDLAGHEVELQKLGTDGLYHAVASGFVDAASVYRFAWTFGVSGAKTFRVHVPGGPSNVGGYSPSVTVTASLPPVQSLPPAS
jgi:hypothetical protein